jgi:hypothetical protein
VDVHIFQMHTWINSVSADVVFVEAGLVERVLALDEPVAATSSEGFLIGWMKNAQIIYDKHVDRLSQLQDKIREREWRMFETSSDAHYEDWFWTNFDLRHIQRLARSTESIHLMTADLRLMACISGLPRLYMRVRGLEWRGEKAALRYLQEHTVSFFDHLTAFLEETERTKRVELSGLLVSEALAPIGQMWSDYSTAVYLRAPSKHPQDVEQAIQFWADLLS